MVFNDYIKALGLLEMKVIIRDNSSITIPKALNILRARANKVSSSYPDIDVKVSMTDFRTGNIYEVFSDAWCKKYNQTSWWNLQFDNVSLQKVLNGNSNQSSDILKGFSKNITITSKDGVEHIEVNSKNYDVFVKVLNIRDVLVSVENKSENGFDLTVYDTSTFEQLKMDCSKNPIKVNYVIIYE